MAQTVDTLTIRKGLTIADGAVLEHRDSEGNFMFGVWQTGPRRVSYFMASNPPSVNGKVEFQRITLPTGSENIKVEFLSSMVDIVSSSRLFVGGKQLKVGTDGKPTF